MGKIVEKKKKKGRPSLLDIQKRTLREEQQNQRQTNPTPNFTNPIVSNPNYDPKGRFTRRNPKSDNIITGEEDEFEEYDSNGKQREKKFKLVLRLPPQSSNSQLSSSADGENSDTLLKKRKIDQVGGRSVHEDGEKEEKHNFASKQLDTSSGMPLESGTTTPLPDKKLLMFILDRLQKKDTYGVYSEPVDPKELPDYHEIVEHPMDFGTVRKKLSSGVYANLEQFEKDIFLICSNAMKYNAPDTIYFRQARSIQELAKKDFENLRQDSDDNESQPKIVRRGRPPTKNLKKRLGRPPIERLGSEVSSNATLANAGDNNGSNSYDLRRGPSGSSEMFGWSAEANDEIPAYGTKGLSMKFGKKHFVLDENRRNTYIQSQPLVSGRSPSVLATFDGEKKQLMAVGLHMEHGFARSLARFAATLGPIAWKIASKKIERALPAGVKFGPGWVVENETPSSKSSLPMHGPAHLWPQESFSVPKILTSTTAPSIDVKVEDRHGLSSNSASDIRLNRMDSPPPAVSSSLVGNMSCGPTIECGNTTGEQKTTTGVCLLSTNDAGIISDHPFRIHHGPVLHQYPNGFVGGFQNSVSQMNKLVRPVIPAEGITSIPSVGPEMHDPATGTNKNMLHSASKNHIQSENTKLSDCLNTINSDSSWIDPSGESQLGTGTGLKQSSGQESSEHEKSDAVPPDLNVRFQSPGSPTSTQQPELALQL